MRTQRTGHNHYRQIRIRTKLFRRHLYNATVITLKFISYGCYIAAVITFFIGIVFNTPSADDLISGAYNSYLTEEYLKLLLIVTVGMFIGVFDDAIARAERKCRHKSGIHKTQKSRVTEKQP